MDNFTFYAPTYFDFGKGAEKHVADLIKKFGGHKVLLALWRRLHQKERTL